MREPVLFYYDIVISYFFNKKMIVDNNLENPYDLVREGKWTLEKMDKMVRDVSRDLNGNAEYDTDDQYGFMGERASMAYTLVGCGQRFSDYNDKGELYLYRSGRGASQAGSAYHSRL